MHVTERQAEILALMARGLADKEIARRLGLSHGTVRTHIDRLFRDHGWHSRTEAVATWRDAQWAGSRPDVPNFGDFHLSTTES